MYIVHIHVHWCIYATFLCNLVHTCTCTFLVHYYPVLSAMIRTLPRLISWIWISIQIYWHMSTNWNETFHVRGYIMHKNFMCTINRYCEALCFPSIQRVRLCSDNEVVTSNQCPWMGSVSAVCFEFQRRGKRRKGHKSCALQMFFRSTKFTVEV